MAATSTIQIPLGFRALNFCLPDQISGKDMRLNDVKGRNATVVIFICNHCPFVIHIIEKVVEIANKYRTQRVNFVAINSNDIENYPDDSPEKMREFAEKYNFTFPYFFDESQQIAKSYQAACTPDFNVFDKDLKCVYRGRFDGARPGNDISVTGNDLINVLECLLNNGEIPSLQIPSLGCNIKWRN